MKKFCTLFLLIVCTVCMNAQLGTTNTLTPTQLVNTILLGSGITATNVVYTGSPNSIAQFTASAGTNLGLSSGILMCSGKAFGTGGPSGNVSASASTDLSMPGDADLNNIIPGTQDACVLEFDFVPVGDTLSLRYVFASDEYPTFVCSSYADEFAYLVSGPNPSGGNYSNFNIATIPGTSLPVSINSINSGSPGSSYPSSGCLSTSYSALFTNNQSPPNTFIKYNGMSKIIRAKLHVICGQTYHIKIAIADVSDGTLDSGVFLERGSFTSAAPISVSSSNANLNLTDSLVLIENCNSNCVYFIRQGNISQADSFNLHVGGNAILDTDYVQMANPSFTWPSKIYFNANQDTVSICNIFALQDNIPESTDTIRFSISTFTTGLSVCTLPATISFNLYIKDYTPMHIGQGDSSFCNQNPVLVAHVSGGVPGYGYNWQPGSGASATYTVGALTQTTIFTLTVNDACNIPVTKSFSVNITPTVSVANALICVGETAVLTATGAGTYSWSTGSALNPITVSPTSTTNYTVTGFIGPCTNTAVTTVSIITTPTVHVTGNNSICNGQSTTLTASGASSYTWSTSELTPSINVSPAGTTNYQVTGGIGTCTAVVVYPVNVTPIPTVSIAGSIICSGQTASLTASGATDYAWSTGSTQAVINPMPLTNTTYSVVGSTGNCTNTAAYTVSVTTDAPSLENISPLKFCVDTVKKIPVIVISNNPNYTIVWTVPSNGVTPTNVGQVYSFSSPQASSGIYTITVTDLCNKKSSVYTDITITTCAISIPNVVTANGDNVNEYFKITGLESFSNSVLMVYNRWGNRVYNNSNYNNDWKPDVNAGTYFYVLSLTDGRKFNGFFEVFKN